MNAQGVRHDAAAPEAQTSGASLTEYALALAPVRGEFQWRVHNQLAAAGAFQDAARIWAAALSVKRSDIHMTLLSRSLRRCERPGAVLCDLPRFIVRSDLIMHEPACWEEIARESLRREPRRAYLDLILEGGLPDDVATFFMRALPDPEAIDLVADALEQYGAGRTVFLLIERLSAANRAHLLDQVDAFDQLTALPLSSAQHLRIYLDALAGSRSAHGLVDRLDRLYLHNPSLVEADADPAVRCFFRAYSGEPVDAADLVGFHGALPLWGLLLKCSASRFDDFCEALDGADPETGRIARLLADSSTGALHPSQTMARLDALENLGSEVRFWLLEHALRAFVRSGRLRGSSLARAGEDLAVFAGALGQSAFKQLLRGVLASEEADDESISASAWAYLATCWPDDRSLIQSCMQKASIAGGVEALETILALPQAGALRLDAFCFSAWRAVYSGNLKAARLLYDRAMQHDDIQSLSQATPAGAALLRTSAAVAGGPPPFMQRPRGEGGHKPAVVVDPGHVDAAGHHPAYNSYFSRLLTALTGEAPSVLINQGAEGSTLAGAEPEPRMRFQPYAYSDIERDPAVLANLNAFFRNDLDESLDPDLLKIFVFHSLKLNMIQGVATWLEANWREDWVAVLGVIEVDHLAQTDTDPEDAGRTIREAMTALSKLPRENIILFSETEAGRDWLEEACGGALTVSRYPYLAASAAARATRDSGAERPTFGMVGGTRPERGHASLFAAMARIRERTDFLIHFDFDKYRTFPQVNVAEAKAAMGRAGTRILSGFLSEPEYFEALTEIDCLILPYSGRYMVSGSGVVYEGMYAKKHFIVSKGSTLEAALCEFDYPHLAVDPEDSDALAAAIQDMASNWSRWRARLAEWAGREIALPPTQFEAQFKAILSRV
ncbi:MAG: hypothetical protein RKE49_01625 [Oceanicaulis sp.]